jgi:hypothetical protein
LSCTCAFLLILAFAAAALVLSCELISPWIYLMKRVKV